MLVVLNLKPSEFAICLTSLTHRWATSKSTSIRCSLAKALPGHYTRTCPYTTSSTPYNHLFWGIFFQK